MNPIESEYDFMVNKVEDIIVDNSVISLSRLATKIIITAECIAINTGEITTSMEKGAKHINLSKHLLLYLYLEKLLDDLKKIKQKYL